jgi:SAM-dependent methyltransferase
MASPDSAAFSGSVPAVYDRDLGSVFFEPYAENIAERLADLREGAVLETAAGTGIVTAALAQALPAAVTITATDLNDAMLAVAAAKPELDRVRWLTADALALPFGDAEFDALVCSFGAMFFPDRVAGYAEGLRVLRPGGRFLFTVWDSLEHNDLSRIVHEEVQRAFPDDPPDFFPRTPFGYSDPAVLRDDVGAAGFTDIVIEKVARPCRADSPRQAAVGLCQGTPLRMQIEARGGDLEAVTIAAATALEREFGRGPIVGRMQALVITAVR